MDTSVNEKNIKFLTKRELTRLVAVMVLTAIFYVGKEKKQEIINSTIDNKLWLEEIPEIDYNTKVDKEFLDVLVSGVLDNFEALQSMLSANISNPKITLDSLDKTVLQILLLGCYELLKKDIDKTIVISQYVLLTKCFFDDNESKIINAILQSVSNNSI